MTTTSAHAPTATSDPAPSGRSSTWWHVALILLVSGYYEYSFVHLGLNLLDEGWPLYAAKRMHEGGTLYRDAFFVFPPGHVLAAWLGYGWSPPGIIPARAIYALFSTGAALGIYFVARRFMPATFALLGAILLALAAPYSHVAHYLFGYRYLVFALLALLAFFRRVEREDPRWMLAAGLCAGVALSFRLTPAFAVSFAIAVGVMAVQRSWRSWVRDWAWYAAGVLLIAVPVVGVMAWELGFETLWREIIVRPLVMTDLQSLSMPSLSPPRFWTRANVRRIWSAVQFRAYMVLYAGYLLALGWMWWRAVARKETFRHALLLTTAIFAAIFFSRSFGRSDVAHLDSTLPPTCIFLAHLLSLAVHRMLRPPRFDAADRAIAGGGLGLALLAGWIYVFGTDLHFETMWRATPFQTVEGVTMKDRVAVIQLDRRITSIRTTTEPGDTILDLSFAPLFYVLGERDGPGWFDLVMPGTFLDAEEERFFVSRLERLKPTLVIGLDRNFDSMPARSINRIAPQVSRWVKKNFEVREPLHDYILLYPRHRGEEVSQEAASP